MNKFFSWMMIFGMMIILGSCKSAKDIEQSVHTVQGSKALDNALLWEISGNGLNQPSYLYGTIHIIGGEDYFLPEGTLTAIEKTDKMVFEIDMNEMTDITSQMGLLSEIFMKNNTTLKDLLSEENYEIVSSHFKEMGLPIFMLERMKPMFLTIFASGDFDINGLQSGNMKSYEMEFFDMAQRTNKEVGGLETMEFQMSMFDSIPYKAQADMLVETIQASDLGSDQFKEMVDLYKSQDITAMVTMINEDEGGVGDFGTLLVDTRNKNWIPLMAEMMVKQPIFFAVGAGHLAGVNGVIPLLMKEGYTLKPIKSAEQL